MRKGAEPSDSSISAYTMSLSPPRDPDPDSFLSPPRHPYARVFIFFVLRHPCSRYVSVLPEYRFAFRLAASLSDYLRHFCIMFDFIIRFVFFVLLISFSGLTFVVSSYPVRWRFTCLTLEFASLFFVFDLYFLCITVCDHRISISLG